MLANSNLDDPLENAEQLADQMESLPFIFRFEYEDMSKYFCSLMDPVVTAYSRGLAPGLPWSSDLELQAFFAVQLLTSQLCIMFHASVLTRLK